jgi:hypothetical protein
VDYALVKVARAVYLSSCQILNVVNDGISLTSAQGRILTRLGRENSITCGVWVRNRQQLTLKAWALNVCDTVCLQATLLLLIKSSVFPGQRGFGWPLIFGLIAALGPHALISGVSIHLLAWEASQ